jgi:hypothetical protein
MDRVIVYPGALPQDTDVLYTNLFGLLSEAFQNAAFVGTSTAVAGLACTPTAPASLQVNVGVGSIFQMDEVDASAYGSLGTNANNVVKMGILPIAQTLTITPPPTTGYSQVYLVEAALQDIDGGSMALSYYNSADSADPFSGPNDSGSSNYTQRSCRCVIQLKAGVPATAGTQVTPSADVGFVGLYAITVSNGTTQIVSTNIAQLPSAPFFPTLPQIPYQVQGGNYIYAGQDTGVANAYVITFQPGQPIPTAYTPGMTVKFKALNACTTTGSTVNVNGLGAVTIHRASGVALTTGDIVSGQLVELTYDGTYFQMANYLGSGATSNTTTQVDIPYVADSGTQNQIVATYTPAIAALTDGLYLAVKLAFTITGAATMNVNGLGAKPVVLGDGTNPPFNVFVAGMDLLVAYSTAMGAFQIANTSAGMFYRRPTSNYTIYVNTATGSDTLYDGTSATVTGVGTAGPFKTIGKAMLTAFSYAPSQYSITIQIAAGSYNEAVFTPGYAGPNVIINGASAASVLINSGNSHTVVVSGPNTLTVQNVTVQNNGNPQWAGFQAYGGGSMVTSNTASNTIGATVFTASEGGTMNPGNHTFSGSSGGLFESIADGTLNLANATFTFSTPISVSTAAAIAYAGGFLQVNVYLPPTFVNPTYVSGPKYLAQYNGVVAVNGLGANYFPGTTPGNTYNGGWYIP